MRSTSFSIVAFDYERRETPSLQGFLTWLRDARAEVKRDMEIRRDEVRVMTVHGAKGLEAPVVILADTITPPGREPPRLLQLADGAVIWAAARPTTLPDVAAARTAALAEAEHEYRRLLYVAMTRAADRLIVGGADGVNRRPPGCWYNLVRDAARCLCLLPRTRTTKKFCAFANRPARKISPAQVAVSAENARSRSPRSSFMAARSRRLPKRRGRYGFRRPRPSTKRSPALRRRAPSQIGKKLRTRPHRASADAVFA